MGFGSDFRGHMSDGINCREKRQRQPETSEEQRYEEYK